MIEVLTPHWFSQIQTDCKDDFSERYIVLISKFKNEKQNCIDLTQIKVVDLTKPVKQNKTYHFKINKICLYSIYKEEYKKQNELTAQHH